MRTGRSLFEPLQHEGSVAAADSRQGSRYRVLARNFETLASETRVHLLHLLRTPKALSDIQVEPSLTRTGENPERPLTRQAVSRHLDQLQEQGLVKRIPADSSKKTDTYVLNHERLFAMVDEIRALAKLRPVVQDPAGAGQTMVRGVEGSPPMPKGPRVVVVYGRDDGLAFPLDGPVGSHWTLGRAPRCQIRLDYDPFVSSENSRIERGPQEFLLHDLLSSRNGTWLNWRSIPRGGSSPLRSGDVLTIGRSLLVFQA